MKAYKHSLSTASDEKTDIKNGKNALRKIMKGKTFCYSASSTISFNL
jgi:hypothetical protein